MTTNSSYGASLGSGDHQCACYRYNLYENAAFDDEIVLRPCLNELRSLCSAWSAARGAQHVERSAWSAARGAQRVSVFYLALLDPKDFENTHNGKDIFQNSQKKQDFSQEKLHNPQKLSHLS